MVNLKPPLPKEHGAWAMLIVPLVLGWAIAPAWHWRSLILFVAALGFFLLRYPLAVLVKTRKRASEDNAYWWRWTTIYAGLTLASAAWMT